VGVRRRLSAQCEVTALDGRVWKVRRRWKLRLRWRRLDVPGFDTFDAAEAGALLGGVDSLGALVTAIAIGILVLAALALLVAFVLPLVLLVLDAVVLAVWVVALGRSWTVEAVTEGPPPEALRIHAVGWRGSRRAVATTADALERGALPR
jgi:hypothetical protein